VAGRQHIYIENEGLTESSLQGMKLIIKYKNVHASQDINVRINLIGGKQ